MPMLEQPDLFPETLPQPYWSSQSRAHQAAFPATSESSRAPAGPLIDGETLPHIARIRAAARCSESMPN